MSSRVVQVFSFQIKVTTILLAHTLGMIERRRASYIVAEQRHVFFLKLARLDDWQVFLLQVLHCGIENLWHIGTTEFSVKSFFVY